jgi:hypothetical protein
MSASTKEKYQSIVNLLYVKTMSKDIEWKPDILDEDTVTCSIGKNSVELTSSRKNDGTPIVIVTVRDSNGREADSFDDENLHGMDTPYQRFEDYWQLMTDLIDTARRQTKGADIVLDDIIKNLEDEW